MPIFDPKFRDFPDYILGITREIWEDRGVGPALKRYYADDVRVRAPSGLIRGNDGITAATLQTLNEFPDRQLVGEDVIWTEASNDTLVSSHRLISVMHHMGDGAFGNASGNRVKSRIIAECVVRNNQVVEEWLVRDQAAFARCLGTTAKSLARHQVETDLRVSGKVQFFTPDNDVAADYANQIDKREAAQVYAESWRKIWNDKNPSQILNAYAPGAAVNIPGGDTLNGHGEIDRFIINYQASFPDGTLEIDHLIFNENVGYPGRVAMRWSYAGTHSGFGRFGEPTGAPIYIMGLTQAYVINGKILMEWILIDEVAIWKQIMAHQDLSK